MTTRVCNVLGGKGVDPDGGRGGRTPQAMLTTPSCVPAVPGFEDSGASAAADNLGNEARLYRWFRRNDELPGHHRCAERAHNISETLKADKNCASRALFIRRRVAASMHTYASGVRCCHESTRAEDALAKMRARHVCHAARGLARRSAGGCSGHHGAQSGQPIATMISDDTRIRWLQTVISITASCVVRKSPSVSIYFVLATAHNASRWITARLHHPGQNARTSYLLITKKISACHRVLIDGGVVAENGKLTIEPAGLSFPHGRSGVRRRDDHPGNL